MNFAKYIVVKRDANAPERALLFPADLRHVDMLPHGVLAVSAGAWALMPDGEPLVVAGSTTLNLEPRPQDGRIIGQTLVRGHV